MKTTILKRIEELGAEAANLISLKSHYEQSIKDIEAKLQQISGAISELDSLSKISDPENPST